MANNPNQISYIPSIEGLVIRPVSGDIEKKSASETNTDYANLLKTLESRFATKSDVGHTHDDRYYTEVETDLLLYEKPDISILALPFDEEFTYLTGSYVSLGGKVYRYITDHQPGPFDIVETEMVTIAGELEGKSDVSHNHNGVYAPVVHNHDGVYAPVVHNHNGVYAPVVHTHTDKADNAAIAPVFRNDVNYAVGDVVSNEGGLYRFLSPHTAGDWNRSEVVVTNAISEGGGGGGGGGGVGDEITFDGHNMIITSSDRSIESLESSIAIVATGDTHPEINAGQYVYVKLHDTLGEGLYTANSYIAEGAALSSSNLTSVPGGGMNSLKSSIDSDVAGINSSLSAIDSSLAIVSDSDTHVAISSGQYVYVKNHTTLAEGLYTANSAIGANVALTSSNLTSVISNGGGFNKINSSISTISSSVSTHTTEINNLKKSTAANFSFNSGIVRTNWGSTYSICGKVVSFTFNVEVNASANTTVHLGTYPNGARPLRKFSQNSINNNYNGFFYLEIETNGNVYVCTNSANPALRFSSSFIAA